MHPPPPPNVVDKLPDSEGIPSDLGGDTTLSKQTITPSPTLTAMAPSPLSPPSPDDTSFTPKSDSDGKGLDDATETFNVNNIDTTLLSTTTAFDFDTDYSNHPNVDEKTTESTTVSESAQDAKTGNTVNRNAGSANDKAAPVDPNVPVSMERTETTECQLAAEEKYEATTKDSSRMNGEIETKDVSEPREGSKSQDDVTTAGIEDTGTRDTSMTNDASESKYVAEMNDTTKEEETPDGESKEKDPTEKAKDDIAVEKHVNGPAAVEKNSLADTDNKKEDSETAEAPADAAEPGDVITNISHGCELDPLSFLPADPMLDDLLTPLERMSSIASISYSNATSRNPSFAFATPQPSIALSSYASYGLISRHSLVSNAPPTSQAKVSHPPPVSVASQPTPSPLLNKSAGAFADKPAATATFETTLNTFLSRTNVPDKATIIASLDTIFTILRHPSADRKELVETLLAATFNAISTHSDDAHLHMRTTLLLSTTGPHTPLLTSSLLSTVPLRKLLSLLETHPQNGYIQSRVLATLTPIARHPPAIAPLVAHRGIELVVWSLETFKTLRPIVTHAAAIFRSICMHGTPCSHTRLARVGALSALTSSLTRWSVNPLVQTAIIASLSSILEPSGTNQWIAGRLSLVPPVVAAMSAAPHNLLLQIVSARTIAAFTMFVADNRTQALESDFVPAATRALDLFGEDTAIADAFLTAIYNLSDGTASAAGLASTTHSQVQTLNTVLHLLHVHARDDKVSTRAAQCVRILLRSANNRCRLLRSDALNSLLSVTHTAATGPFSSQTEALFGALANAVYDHAENAERLAGNDGIAVISAGMRTHVESSGVLRQGLRFLRNACVMTAFTPKLVKEAMAVTVIAVLGHNNDRALQHEACHLLLNIYKGTSSAATRDNKAYMIGLGTTDALSEIRGLHKDDEVLHSMINALLTLLRNDSSSDISHTLGGNKSSDAVQEKDRLRQRYTLRRIASEREKLAID